MTHGHRIVILSASIGGGHVTAGRALEAAFGSHGIASLHIDLLDYTSAPFRAVYRDAYEDLIRMAPDLVELFGKRLDRNPSEIPTRWRRVRGRISRLISYQLPRVLQRYRPDLVVHTHFMPAEILSTRWGSHDPKQAIVVTDFGAHALWLTSGMSRYFVATDEVSVHLRASGVDEGRIDVTGIPIDPAFTRLPSRARARERLGVDPDRSAVLVMAGGMPRRTLAPVLEELRTVRHPTVAWIVCGRSDDLLEVAHAAADAPRELVRLVPLGFVHDIPLRMAAADLVVGKPGGLTTSEALAAALPFVVVDPYPLQEEANARFLLETGAGIRVDPLTTFGHKVEALLGDRARRDQMAVAARSVGRPDAAGAVARSCIRMMDEAS